MFCGHCGARNREDDHFCGICGVKLPEKEPEIVYIEEKPMEPILNNQTVIALTFFFFVLTILAIVLLSVITKGIPEENVIKIVSSIIPY